MRAASFLSDIQQLPFVPWSVDVHSHTSIASLHFPFGKKAARKSYVSESTAALSEQRQVALREAQSDFRGINKHIIVHSFTFGDTLYSTRLSGMCRA